MEWQRPLLLLVLTQVMMSLLVSSQTSEECPTLNSLTCSNYCPSDPSDPETNLCEPMCPSKTTTLYIQGFVPAGNDVFVSEGIVPAAYIAIDEINANCSILPDYRLELAMANTKCDASESTWQLINAIVLNADRAQPKIMFLGGGCSPATEPLAALSGRFYNVTQISYGASSPTLSDREMFPRFFRTIPSEVQSNAARFALMKKYNWLKVATLHETRNIFSQTVEDFHTQYKKMYNSTDDSAENEENLILRSFTDDPEIPLRQIREKDIRIILGYFYENKAVKTLCQAYHMNLTTANHLWMFPAWFEAGWWNVSYPNKEDNNTDSTYNCTREQMQQAVKNSLFLDSHNFGLDENATTASGTTNATFFKKYNCYLEDFINSSCLATERSTFHFYSTFTYDAVWAMAYSLDQAEDNLQAANLSLTDFQYNNTMNIASYIENATRDLDDFLGVSGDVRFNENGTRIGLNAIYQLQENNNTKTLELRRLVIHNPMPGEGGDPFLLNFTNGIEPQFNTPDGMPPRDRRRPVNQYLNRELVIVCGIVTGVAIVITLGLLVFNLVTIRKPLIRDSAPIINTIVIVGCLVVLVSCFLLGVDSRTPAIDTYVTQINDEDIPDMERAAIKTGRDERYTAICIVRLWLLTLGFTLSFGALFAKTWQVYRIYTNPKLKKEAFKMWNFLIILSIFLVIDLAYLAFWTGAPSPDFRFFRDLERRQDENNDLELFYEKCECNNFGYLIGALYVYKGLLVVFGLFLAYESRNVKYIHINDSRFVSIAMYIVVIVVGIGAPLSLVLAVHFFIDAAYVLAVLMIIGSTMSCLLILFIPKFVYMAKGEDTMIRENSREEITVSDGLQLGKSSMDQNEIRTVEDEVDTLKQQVSERDAELKVLEDVEAGTGTTTVSLDTATATTAPSSSSSSSGGGAKPRSGSDNDSGVGVTVDETETFSTESTNGEGQRAASSQLDVPNTPSPTEREEEEEGEGEGEENTEL